MAKVSEMVRELEQKASALDTEATSLRKQIKALWDDFNATRAKLNLQIEDNQRLEKQVAELVKTAKETVPA
jgi:chaperonin cofactor prefoldin